MFLFNLTDELEFFGVIYSLILIAGLYQIGSLIFKINTINKIFIEISDTKYQKVFLSTNLILLVCYPLILYSNKINFIPILSIILFFFGLFKIFNKLKKKIKLFKIKFDKNQIDRYLVLFTILALFLLSLSPNTHGDSLGYHFVVAKKLLSSGKYFADITHFHSLLAGSGEIIIAVGLFFGSEQFGGLIQFSGLVSIFGIFKKIDNKNKYYYFLLVITTPIILFLSSTAKPQLFHICSSVVIFSLYFLGNSKNLTSNEEKWKIVLSLLILLVSVSAKFNLILSSFILIIYIFYISIKNNNHKFFLYASVLIFLTFYLPIIFWKYVNLGGNFFQYFYSPLPLSILGFEEFTEYLARYGRGTNYLKIIFPTNLNQLSNSIGIAFGYIFLLNLRNKDVRIVFLMVISYLLLNYLFGQFIGRTFLEPLFWILLISAKYGNSLRLKILEYFCRFQALIVIGAILYGVFSIFPGTFSKENKDIVLSDNASGYSLFKWANTKLNTDDVLFSIHRSIALGKSQYIATDFVPFVNFKNARSKIFINEVIDRKPKFILTYGYPNQKPKLGKFKDCVDELKYFKKFVGTFEARNPYNRGSKYNGYIYKFNLSKFPKCMKER
ncbi:DUF1420 family protein [Candidatus Pelagibacter sp.]|nr:DUF1420 family protein [Candidatus Pelagibacter sp.]